MTFTEHILIVPAGNGAATPQRTEEVGLFSPLSAEGTEVQRGKGLFKGYPASRYGVNSGSREPGHWDTALSFWEGHVEQKHGFLPCH